MYEVALIGAGGHSRSLFKIIRDSGFEIKFVVSLDKPENSSPFKKYKWFPNDKSFYSCILKDECLLVNGLGPNAKSSLNRDLFRLYTKLGYKFPKLISKKASLGDSITLGEGVQVLSGTIINSYSSLSNNVLINTGALIEHDCQIGDNAHVGPGAILCGGVLVGDNAVIGPGSIVTKNISIGKNVIVGAGSLIMRNLQDNEFVFGVVK